MVPHVRVRSLALEVWGEHVGGHILLRRGAVLVVFLVVIGASVEIRGAFVLVRAAVLGQVSTMLASRLRVLGDLASSEVRHTNVYLLISSGMLAEEYS